jgi:hypothetical protein
VVVNPGPLITHPVLRLQFRVGSRPATISGLNGEAIGSIRAIRGGRRWRPGPLQLGFFELDGDEAWRIKHDGYLWDPSEVLLPGGQLVGEVSPHGVRLVGRALIRLQPQQPPGAKRPAWKLVAASGVVIAEIAQVLQDGRQRWRVELHPQLVVPLRYLAAAAAYSCHNSHILNTGD